MTNADRSGTLRLLSRRRRLDAVLTIQLRALALAAILLAAGFAALAVGPAAAQGQPVDYDADDDGLIEVTNLAQLNAIRWDLDGDGSSTNAGYATAFPNPATGMGCPQTGCTGYELSAVLDFDTNGSGGPDSGDAYWNGGHGWLPIGDGAGAFSAVFEGNGEVISNLYIDSDPEKYSAATTGLSRRPGPIGLFETIAAEGVVRNLGLAGVDIAKTYPCYDRCADGHTGALAGTSHGKISGSWSTGVVTVTATYAEEYPGPAYGDEYALRVGGLVGFAGASSAIANSYSVVSVTALSPGLSNVGVKAGGLVGHNAGAITASYAAGRARSNGAPAWRNLAKFVNIGGLVGHNAGAISASYAAAVVSGPDSGVGGLVGRATGDAAVSDSYYDSSASGQSASDGGAAKTTAQLQTTTETSTVPSYTPYTGIYANWNVDLDGDSSADDPWQFGTASQYPVLSGLGVSAQRGHTRPAMPEIDYDSDDDGLIEISAPFQLHVVGADPDGDGSPSHYSHAVAFPDPAAGMGCPQMGCTGYELVADLALGYIRSIGADKDHPFAATFEGNGHTIGRVGSGRGYPGYDLFGTIGASGVVRNLTLNSAAVGGSYPMSSLADTNHGTISNVHVNGATYGTPAGLLAAYNGPTGVIMDSSSAGTVRGHKRQDQGGLVGRNAGAIRSSYSSASLDGNSNVNMGGLVGRNLSTGSIRASYATGAVSDYVHYNQWATRPLGRNLGGLVGRNDGEISASYSIGLVSGTFKSVANHGYRDRAPEDEVIGGLVGRNGGPTNDSYFDSRTAGSWNRHGPGRKTTQELQRPFGYHGIYANWNVDLDGDGAPDDPWSFGSRHEYPTLKPPNERLTVTGLRNAATYTVPFQAGALEGRWIFVTITLNKPAPSGGVRFSVTPIYNSNATASDVGSISSPVTVPAGESTFDIVIPTFGDHMDRPHKFFTLTVTALTSGWSPAGDGWDTTTVAIWDDDAPGIRIIASRPFSVAEGGTATYRMSLASQPTADVTITPTSSDPGAASVSPASYTWTPSNWNSLTTFTVSGVADGDADHERVVISHQASSQDGRFNGFRGYVRVAVWDSESPQQQASPIEGEGEGEETDYAQLVARIYEWRNDPLRSADPAHVERWDRALLAFGETLADSALSPMAASEAQGYVDRGWTRWVEVVQALTEIEAAAQQPPVQQGTANRAPTVAHSIENLAIFNQRGTYQFSLSGFFADADGDRLTITAASSNEAVATVSVAADYTSLTVTAKAWGRATITVTADDGNGGTVSDTFNVTVAAKSAPTVASALADLSGLEAGSTRDVSLSGVFADANGDTLTISAVSSDDAVATVRVAADGSKLTVTAVSQGTATIAVTANDGNGGTVSDTFSVTVNSAPTVASAFANLSNLQAGATQDLSLSGVFTDADGDDLTVTAESSNDAVATVSVAADGARLTVAGVSRGTATITVTASDGNTGTVSDTFNVQVKAAPVVASAIGDVSGLTAGTTRDVSLSGVFSDADGDTLTISASSSNDAVATVTVAADSSKLTVSAVSQGTATTTVTARDSDGNTVSDSFDVQVGKRYAALIAKMREYRNDPCCVHHKPHTDRWDRALLAFGETVADGTLTAMPASEAQTYVDRGWTRWVEVVQALTAIEAAAQQQQQSTNTAPTVSAAIADATIVNEIGTKRVSLSGVFAEADNDTLTISAGTSNSGVAGVSVAADHSALTLTARSRGTATITVTASDGNGGTVEDTFTVKVKAAPVVASAIADISGMELFGTSEVSLSGVFTDADGDSLTITAESSDDDVASAVVGQDNELTIFALETGSVTVTVTARDADGNTVSDVFSVSVGAPQPQPVNNAPTVSSAIADAVIVNESGTRRISLSGVFTDADNDSLTISSGTSNSAVAAASVSADYATLTLTARSRGTATITVTASDGDGGTVSDSFSVRVKSAPVVASAIADVSGLTAGTSRDVWLSSVFRDADGDSLTISAASSNSVVAPVSVAGGGSRLRLTGAAEGTATITVTARDADGNTVSDEFTVTVTERPATQPDSATDSPLVGVAARYDANGDGVIDEDEYLKAVDDYDDGKLTILEILQVRRARQAAPR